jgi:HEPN domain-containing protein
MAKDKLQAESAKMWVGKGRSALAKARTSPSGERTFGDQCNDSRMAAEKALAGALLAARIPFRFTHGAAEFVKLLKKSATPPPGEVEAAALKLAAYDPEHVSDYFLAEATASEARVALALAEVVVSWAEKVVGE